ncbi:MAG: YihY/virulence factor BrkB family protein [Candidatus Kapabacteria bacterium]|nr:YihY/virulence factor BrkB family protein [Candidatus Kapabacteria bacterium]
MPTKINDPNLRRIADFLHIRNLRLRELVGAIETLSDRLNLHHTFLVAAGIAFNILLYLIPLLLVIIFAISSFFKVEDITRFLTHFLNDILPPSEQTRSLLELIIKEVTKIFGGSGTAGIVGIVSLLWLSSILLGSIRSGLNTIFSLPSDKNFLIYKLKDIGLILMLSVMVLVTIYVLPIIGMVLATLHSTMPDFFKPYLSGVMFTSVTLLMSFLMFYFLYRYVPNRKVRRGVVMLSTGLCVVFVEISRRIFALYIAGVTSYGKFYGTYAILVSMAVWLYYLTMILLLSAEISQLFFDIRDSKKVTLPAPKPDVSRTSKTFRL